jgi:cell division protein FtsB
MIAFAVEGGEYGSSDLRSLRRQAGRERGRIDTLQREVDSLGRLLRLLNTDSATQERAARELYGMIRDGELLYQVVPDTTKRERTP